MKDNKEQLLDLALGRSRQAIKWENTQITWAELVDKLSQTHRTQETYAQYQTLSKAEQDEIKDVGGFVGGYLQDGKRTAAHVVSRQLLTLDVDFAPVDFWEQLEMFFDFACCVYSTHKHCSAQPRLRVVIPLSRSVGPLEYEAIGRKVAEDLGRTYFDETTYQPSRLMYWPSTSWDGDYFFQVQEGPWLDADEVLGRYAAWQDASNWPQSSRSLQQGHTGGGKAEDPTTKAGLVGVFCRTYGIKAAIETFLAAVYTPCEVPNRYTYVGGSTSGGLVLYEGDKFAYSNHATDPAGGRLCNAFDLVRIHKFGTKDSEAEANTPPTQLPSYAAMTAFILQDAQTKQALGAERLALAHEAFESPKATSPTTQDTQEWLHKLQINQQGKYLSTIENIKTILTHDVHLKDKIGYNAFNMKAMLKGDLPWRKKATHEVWQDSDDSALRHYFEHVYQITGAQKIDDGVAIVLEMNQFHPVRDYLDTLKWDGVKRLDTLFIDYLGASDEAYTRAVTQKAFTAAVARIYEPGIKFDTMTVLTGPQGLGKSTLIHKMGKTWYSDSFNTVIGREAYEQLQGFWLIEMAELTATKKAEVEAVKHFISKQEDSYRQAYGRRVGTYKRQCIFFGTTNDFEFLKDRTGNRRFWPIATKVKPTKHNVFEDLTEPLIDQLWAEAKFYYTQHEPLYLSYEMERIAYERQQAHSEYNAKFGLIKDYLELLLPEDWQDMDLGARRAYIHGSTFGALKQGQVKREKVCAIEIWCELLQGDPKSLSQIQTREINDILTQMIGWEKSASSLRFGKLYGSQRGHIRCNKVCQQMPEVSTD